MDLLPYTRQFHRLSSNKLGHVALLFSNLSKGPVSYAEIPTLQDGTSADRARLAQYCLWDAALPLQLLHDLCILDHYHHIVGFTSLPLKRVLTCDPQTLLYGHIVRSLSPRIFIPNHLGDFQQDDAHPRPAPPPGPESQYRMPLPADPSVYPAAIVNHNLCYSTLLLDRDADEVDALVDLSPEGYAFVPHDTFAGFLPSILQDLCRERACVFQPQAGASAHEEANLSALRLSIDLFMNSALSLSHPTKGLLPCEALHQTAAHYGTLELLKSRDLEQLQPATSTCLAAIAPFAMRIHSAPRPPPASLVCSELAAQPRPLAPPAPTPRPTCF
jgi:DNA polymerase delta subunit 1